MKGPHCYLYLLENEQGTCFYIGVAYDPLSRLDAHNAGKGAKFTRGRGPWLLRGLMVCSNMSIAMQWEAYTKKLTHENKRRFFALGGVAQHPTLSPAVDYKTMLWKREHCSADFPDDWDAIFPELPRFDIVTWTTLAECKRKAAQEEARLFTHG